MSLSEVYPWLKALHVASAFAFVGGVVAEAVCLAAAASTDTGRASTFARVARQWDEVLTTPAMLLVWGFGLALATTGHWFANPWLQAKFAFVLVLSGIHGVRSGRLRRLAGGGLAPALRSASVIKACIVAIAVLTVVKPW